ncbi:MAG: MFS transporter [Muribaculaceae bacterium]
MKQNERSNNHVLPIIIMFALFAMISFVTGLQNPFGVIVKAQFQLSDFESQLGNFANFIAYAFMGVPAGLLLQKKGYRITALTAVLIGLTGVALMFGSSIPNPAEEAGNDSLIYALYISGAFIAGFSMCTLNTVVNPMLNTLGGGGKKGNQLLQFGGATNSLAATIVPILVGYLIGGEVQKADLVDARVALYIAMAIFAIAFIVLFLAKLPEPILEEIAKGNEKEKVSMRGAFKYPQFVGGIIAIFLYVGIEVGIANILNLYLTTEDIARTKLVEGFGMEPVISGTIVGFYWMLMLVGRLIGGSIGGSVSSKTMLIAVAGTCILFLTLGMVLPTNNIEIFGYNIPLNVLFFVLCGLCTSVMWGGIFNIATEGLGKYTAVASGIFMVMVCGGGVLPLIQGVVADMFGYLASYGVLLVAVGYILLYAIFGGKKAVLNK